MEKICPIIQFQIAKLGTNVSLPNSERNYATFDKRRDEEIMAQAEHALKPLEDYLKNNAKTEEEIMDALHILDKMIDEKVEGADKLYPVISKFNNTNSPNIQVMLAGIYRKTLPPDAYGPLNKMLIKQSISPNSPYFDPTEEIGGAILEYIKNYGAKEGYNKVAEPVLGTQLNVSK